MNIISKMAPLSFASIALLGATLNASAGNQAEAGLAQEQAAFQEYLRSAEKQGNQALMAPRLSSVGALAIQTTRLTRAGSGIQQAGVDLQPEYTCPTQHRVRSISAEWSNIGGSVLLTKMTMTCTNGSVLTFGYGGTSGAAVSCSQGNLLSGVLLRTGTAINAGGGTCRNVSTGATSSGGPYGGTGGSRTDRNCGSNQYVIGAKVYMDGATETGRNLLGIEVLCRQGTSG